MTKHDLNRFWRWFWWLNLNGPFDERSLNLLGQSALRILPWTLMYLAISPIVFALAVSFHVMSARDALWWGLCGNVTWLGGISLVLDHKTKQARLTELDLNRANFATYRRARLFSWLWQSGALLIAIYLAGVLHSLIVIQRPLIISLIDRETILYALKFSGMVAAASGLNLYLTLPKARKRAEANDHDLD